MSETNTPAAEIVSRLATQAAVSLSRGQEAVLTAEDALPAEALLALVDVLGDFAREQLGYAGLVWEDKGRRLHGKGRQRGL